MIFKLCGCVETSFLQTILIPRACFSCTEGTWPFRMSKWKQSGIYQPVCESVCARYVWKSFVLPYKCTLNQAAKTHILLSWPDSLPNWSCHNTENVSAIVALHCERHAYLSLCTWVSPYRTLYDLEISAASGRRAGTVPSLGQAFLVRDVKGRCSLLLRNGPLSHI